MRLCLFDRLGGVASGSFDVNKDGQMFVSVILGYLWMNEEELGFDRTIMEGDDTRYTEIQRDSQMERLYLEELMKRQGSVVGRATTCLPDWRRICSTKRQMLEWRTWRSITTMRICVLEGLSTTSVITFVRD
jgi:hypothetical protein